jgi:hypothetical protein
MGESSHAASSGAQKQFAANGPGARPSLTRAQLDARLGACEDGTGPEDPARRSPRTKNQILRAKVEPFTAEHRPGPGAGRGTVAVSCPQRWRWTPGARGAAGSGDSLEPPGRRLAHPHAANKLHAGRRPTICNPEDGSYMQRKSAAARRWTDRDFAITDRDALGYGNDTDPETNSRPGHLGGGRAIAWS